MDTITALPVPALRPLHRPRRPTARRRALERAGWRTWLSHQENQRRGTDGVLTGVATVWQVEAEHSCGQACTIEAASQAAAWAIAVRHAVRHDCGRG
jgi:hypothetical protein